MWHSVCCRGLCKAALAHKALSVLYLHVPSVPPPRVAHLSKPSMSVLMLLMLRPTMSWVPTPNQSLQHGGEGKRGQ